MGIHRSGDSCLAYLDDFIKSGKEKNTNIYTFIDRFGKLLLYKRVLPFIQYYGIPFKLFNHLLLSISISLFIFCPEFRKV